MNNVEKAIVLLIDDDTDFTRLTRLWLENTGYEVIDCNDSMKGIETAQTCNPALILLDLKMPEIDGYEVCSRLTQSQLSSDVPIVFLSAAGSEQDKLKAFSLGASGYLTKPIKKELFLSEVEGYLAKAKGTSATRDKDSEPRKKFHFWFRDFKEFLLKKDAFVEEQRQNIAKIKSSEYCSHEICLGLTSAQRLNYVAEFIGVAFYPFINPELIRLGILSPNFCKNNLVIPIKAEKDRDVFILSNPFDMDLMDSINRLDRDSDFEIGIADPQTIAYLFDVDLGSEDLELNEEQSTEPSDSRVGGVMNENLTIKAARSILQSAASQRASDIHIEPKPGHAAIRFRIDGDMKDIYALQKETAAQVISRFKVIAGMDIAERRKPQDGALEQKVFDKNFKLRLATTSTPHGESLIIRMLNPSIKPKSLQNLGMAEAQVKTMEDFASRDRGFVLIVGPTGSGKTTTIYSLLSTMGDAQKSLLSVEDPVEYRIPFANQQQVNERAGITFEAVLKSTIRQDPDILYLGEIRDPFSAKTSFDFASTGHLTITTLHTSNATSAIFRLERLGISRPAMADTVLGVVAQRLLKKLCDHCKIIETPTKEEIKMLSEYCSETPSKVARPKGCIHCNNTGYFDREGVYEIIEFDNHVGSMIRSGESISQIRESIREKGGYLISNHAAQKVIDLKISPRDAYEKVFVEEPSVYGKSITPVNLTTPLAVKEEEDDLKEEKQAAIAKRNPTILLVEDDPVSLALIRKILEAQDYKVVAVEDGIEALMGLGKETFDLVISDINMPNLHGFKLIEMIHQKGIKVPVIFLTGEIDAESETKGLELGAEDYICKPVRQETLLLRVKRALNDQS